MQSHAMNNTAKTREWQQYWQHIQWHII